MGLLATPKAGLNGMISIWNTKLKARRGECGEGGVGRRGRGSDAADQSPDLGPRYRPRLEPPPARQQRPV